MIVAVVVVVAIVVVAFLGLYFAGAIPGLKPSSPGSSGLTFSGARTAAASATSSYTSTYPNLVLAAGLGLQQPLAGTPSDLAPSGGGCTATPVTGAPTSFTVPAGAGGSSTGSVPFWWFIYAGSTGELFVIVVNGQATVLATVAIGGSCTSPFGSLSAIPSTVVDSNAAATSADGSAGGGSSFLQHNGSANAIFLLIGGVSVSGFSTGPSWEILYSLCSFAAGGSTSSQPQFSAMVDGISGNVLTHHQADLPCTGSLIPTPGSTSGGGSGLSSDISLGTPTEASAGTASYFYNFTVQSAGGGLTWHDLLIEFVSGAVPVNSIGWTATVDGITGSMVASYNFTTLSWSSGGSTAVNAGQTLSVHSAASLSGDSLELVGIGSISGIVEVLVP
jgi:hypothetical protein